MPRNAVRYFRCSPLPHGLAGLAFLIGIVLTATAAEAFQAGLKLRGTLLAFPSAGWYGLGLLSLADGLARYREYLRIKRLIRLFGFRPRILHSIAGSRCRRDAALAAASESGHRNHAAEYFKSLGYRWYHLMPDKIIDNPLYFFNPRFLRSTFLPGKRARD